MLQTSFGNCFPEYIYIYIYTYKLIVSFEAKNLIFIFYLQVPLLKTIVEVACCHLEVTTEIAFFLTTVLLVQPVLMSFTETL